MREIVCKPVNCRIKRNRTILNMLLIMFDLGVGSLLVGSRFPGVSVWIAFGAVVTLIILLFVVLNEV